MQHDIIEAIEYCRQDDWSATISLEPNGLWLYVCKDRANRVLYWNRSYLQWDRSDLVSIGPEHYMRDAEAKECLRRVPTKTEEARQTEIVSPIKIEVTKYRRGDNPSSVRIERDSNSHNWTYTHWYKDQIWIWNNESKSWDPYTDGARKAHRMTGFEAKECLRSVPTLEELNFLRPAVPEMRQVPEEIEVIAYRRRGDFPRRPYIRRNAKDSWTYYCFYDGKCQAWNRLLMTWGINTGGVDSSLTEEHAKRCLQTVPEMVEVARGITEEALVREPHGIEASMYQRPGEDQAHIELLDLKDPCWIYVCEAGDFTWIWNPTSRSWDFYTGPFDNHYLTEEQAKECLLTVPLKKIRPAKDSIQATKYRRKGGVPTTFIAMGLGLIETWKYECRWEGQSYVWDIASASWTRDDVGALTKEEALYCLRSVPDLAEVARGIKAEELEQMPHDVVACEYRCPDTRLVAHIELGNVYWIYRCRGADFGELIWNNENQEWEQYTGPTPDHYLTEGRAKECLLTVPIRKPTRKIPRKKRPRTVDCEFWIRPGVFKSHFQVPSDMSRYEAERFAAAIRTFYFKDDAKPPAKYAQCVPSSLNTPDKTCS